MLPVPFGNLIPENDNNGEAGFLHPLSQIYAINQRGYRMNLVKAQGILVKTSEQEAFIATAVEPIAMKDVEIPGQLFVAPFGRQNAPHKDTSEDSSRAPEASAPHRGDSEDGRVLSLAARAPKETKATDRRGNSAVSGVADIAALKRLREERLQKGPTRT